MARMEIIMNQIVKKAFINTLPIMAGYIVLGIGFGVLLKTAGYGIWWALAMSIFIYAGSMQYAMVGLISGGASYLVIAVTTLFIVVFTDQWLNTKNHISALIGVFASTVCLILCGNDKFLIPSMLVIMFFIVWYEEVLCNRLKK